MILSCCRLQDGGQGRQRNLSEGNSTGSNLGLHQRRRRRNIGADKGSGGLWNNSKGAPGKDPIKLADKPFGEWNAFRIVAVGERVSIWLNGKLVVDHARLENYFNRKGPLPRTGPIQLHMAGRFIGAMCSSVRSERKRVTNFWPQKGTAVLKVFNGKNFKGWGGPVDNYVVNDGTIQCKKGSGGTISTLELSDFSVRFEYKKAAGRQQWLGHPLPSGDSMGMVNCRCWMTAKKYAKLHPAQYHAPPTAVQPSSVINVRW